MARIHTLPAQEAYKIAAGEVVERPVSVVKELLENALDAGATHIQLDIQDGGRQQIRIIDNGHGMDRDDIHACIKEHTTSKIYTCSELQHISSFGFRGEALASISNVSTLTITSQEPNTHEGYTITVDAGTTTNEQVTARSPGTDITVSDLFYNLPARKKFLKKRETEWRAIQQLCTAMAISRPDCAFYVTHDDRAMLQCPRANRYMQRISQVHDRYFAQQFIECSYHDEHNGISAQGVITHPEYHRYDRSMLTCFVNNRWVKNHRLSQAIIKGYADILPQRRFPAGYVFITIPSEEVDINVHPRKEEVQFLHPRRIERTIEHMVRTALEDHTRDKLTSQPSPQPTTPDTSTAASTPSMPRTSTTPTSLSHKTYEEYPSYHAIQPSPQHKAPDTSATPSYNAGEPLHKQPAEYGAPQASAHHDVSSQEPIPDYQQQQQAIQEDAPDTSTQQTAEYNIIGQMHNTYIILENDEGCIFIDQHAAHERILYERFSDTTSITTTKLMFPHRIAMPQHDCDRVISHASHLASYGIVLERFDTSNIVITSVPVALTSINWSDMLNHIASILPDTHEAETSTYHHGIYHELCATMACKAAIKAGDQLSHAEMHELVQQVYTCQHRMTCPHGRPTIITFTHNELERKFKRSV